MPTASLEEVDCEFITRSVSGAVTHHSRAPARVIDAPAFAAKVCQKSDSFKLVVDDDSVSRASRALAAVRDAAFGTGALNAMRDTARAPRVAMAWHARREILAYVDDGGRCVQRDFERANDADTTEHATLRHRAHGRAMDMAWRPAHGRALAMCGPNGVCTWTRERRGARASSAVASETGALSPIDAAKVRALADRTTSGTVSGYRWRLTVYNTRGAHEAGPAEPPGGTTPAERVRWSPDGRFLVAVSRATRVMHVWDVATGSYTPLGADAAGVIDVQFSMCGGYALAARAGEGFHLWRVDGWTRARWSTNGREITAISWGRVRGATGHDCTPVALLAVRGTTTLSAVHVAARDASADVAAHVLPLELPEMTALHTDAGDGARGDGVGASASSSENEVDIVDMAWDASSSRLALALRGGAFHGAVAVYATRATHIVSGSLIGYFDHRSEGGDESGGFVAGARVPACAVRISTPRARDHGKLSASLAVTFANGDISRVPMTFADPARASSAS